MLTPNAADVLTEFETVTAVPRAFFRSLDGRMDVPDPRDLEALYQAGRTLAEAAELLVSFERDQEDARVCRSIEVAR